MKLTSLIGIRLILSSQSIASVVFARWFHPKRLWRSRFLEQEVRCTYAFSTPNHSSTLFFLYFIDSLNSFVGTEMIRGVPADTYKFTKSVTRGGRTHNFDMEVGFIPKGWNFPGRQALSGISVPLHFRNTGNVTTNGVTQGYKDNWDLFLYVPGQPPASRFDPAELGCVFVPPPTAAPAPPLSVTTVVVSAVVGAVVGAILASGTAFYCWRQWRINNPPPVEHKPLPTTELSSMPADAHVPATPHSEATNV